GVAASGDEVDAVLPARERPALGARALSERGLDVVRRLALGQELPGVHHAAPGGRHRGDRPGRARAVRLDDRRRGALVRQPARGRCQRHRASADAGLATRLAPRGGPGPLGALAALPPARPGRAAHPGGRLPVPDPDRRHGKSVQGRLADQAADRQRGRRAGPLARRYRLRPPSPAGAVAGNRVSQRRAPVVPILADHDGQRPGHLHLGRRALYLELLTEDTESGSQTHTQYRNTLLARRSSLELVEGEGLMSLYEVQRLIHKLNVEPGVRERFREAPEDLLAEYALEDAERAALLAGDTAALWRMGVHPLMMLHYARARRIPPPEMYKQIQPLAGERTLRSAISHE